MTKINTLACLLCFLSLAACRKNNNEATSWSAPRSCDYHTEVMVDGKCELKPEYVRYGDLVLSRGSSWVTANSCSGIDSAAIAFRIDTAPVDRYFLSVAYQWYVSNPTENELTDISGDDPEPNYFPDPVRGDSVHFTMRTKDFDWMHPETSTFGEFYGRFNVQRTMLTGKIVYRTGFFGSENGEVCENVAFSLLQ